MDEKIKKCIRSSPVLYRIGMRIIEYSNKIKYRYALKHGKKALITLISKDYKKNTGEDLRVPPVSYTEKMQFAKIFDSNEMKSMLTDKYLVREWVEDRIGKEYLIPLLGVWNNFSEIDFNQLPNQFVLKTNHGSGTNLIVEDKNTLNLRLEKKKFDFWMKEDFAFSGKAYELHYSHINPKIIAEQYVVDKTGELCDYKFLCFEGVPYYCWVDIGRHTKHRRYVFDLAWNLQKWHQHTYEPQDEIIEKPENFEKMIELVSILCQGFGHVRVDLYNVDGRIYFGEMTFTNGGGYELIYPSKCNDELGRLWKQDFDY